MVQLHFSVPRRQFLELSLFFFSCSMLLFIPTTVHGNPTSKPYIAYRTNAFDQQGTVDHDLALPQQGGVTASGRTLVQASTIHRFDEVNNERCPLQFSLGISKRYHGVASSRSSTGAATATATATATAGGAHGAPPSSFAIRQAPVIHNVFPAAGAGRQVLYTTQYEHLDLLSPASLETSRTGSSGYKTASGGGSGGALHSKDTGAGAANSKQSSIVQEALVQVPDFPLLWESSSFHASPILHDVNGDGITDVIVADYDGGISVLGLTHNDDSDSNRRYSHHAQVPRLYVRREWLEKRIEEVLGIQPQQDAAVAEDNANSTTTTTGSKDTHLNEPYHSYFEYYYSNDANQNKILKGVTANVLAQGKDEAKSLKERRGKRVKQGDGRVETTGEGSADPLGTFDEEEGGGGGGGGGGGTSDSAESVDQDVAESARRRLQEVEVGGQGAQQEEDSYNILEHRRLQEVPQLQEEQRQEEPQQHQQQQQQQQQEQQQEQAAAAEVVEPVQNQETEVKAAPMEAQQQQQQQQQQQEQVVVDPSEKQVQQQVIENPHDLQQQEVVVNAGEQQQQQQAGNVQQRLQEQQHQVDTPPQDQQQQQEPNTQQQQQQQQEQLQVVEKQQDQQHNQNQETVQAAEQQQQQQPEAVQREEQQQQNQQQQSGADQPEEQQQQHNHQVARAEEQQQQNQEIVRSEETQQQQPGVVQAEEQRQHQQQDATRGEHQQQAIVQVEQQQQEQQQGTAEAVQHIDAQPDPVEGEAASQAQAIIDEERRAGEPEKGGDARQADSMEESNEGWNSAERYGDDLMYDSAERAESVESAENKAPNTYTDDPDYGRDPVDDEYKRYGDYDDYGGRGYDPAHEEYYDEKHYIRIPPHILCTPVLAELPKQYGNTNEKDDILFVAVSYFFDEDEYEGHFSYKRFNATDHGDETEVKRGSYVASALMAYILGDASRWSGQNHLDLSTDFTAPENATLVAALPIHEDVTSMGAFALASPTVADLNGDGTFEVLVGTSMGMLYAFDARGMYKRDNWPVQLKHPIESRVLVEDVAGDTNLEIFVADIGGNIVCLNHEAKPIWNRNLVWSLGTGGKIKAMSPMTLGDVDGDGLLDLVVSLRVDDRYYVFAFVAGTGEDLKHFPIALEDQVSEEKSMQSDLLQPLAQPLLVDLHADQDHLKDYIKRTTARYSRLKAIKMRGKSDPYPHGGYEPGLHVVQPADKKIFIIEGGSGCTQSVEIGDEVTAMVQVDDVHGTNRLDLVVATTAGNVVTLESKAPYHPLNVWNHGELRGRMNAHAHGYSASQGIFVHEVSRQYRDIFGVYVPVTFEIFDHRPNIANEPSRQKYIVEIRDGTSSKRTLMQVEYNATGVYTERLYIHYGPGYYALTVVMRTTHGIVYEDSFSIGYNVEYLNGFGLLLLLPLIFASMAILLCGVKKANWDDEEGYDGDEHGVGILGRALPA